MNVNMELQRIEINRPYEDVVTQFERIVPQIDQEHLGELVDTGADAGEIIHAINEMAGASHLTRFACMRTGDLFSVLGGTPVESVKYLVGNALFAEKIFRHGLTAGLYVPFVLNFYGNQGKTIFEYFQPSTFLAHVSSDAEVTVIGQKLDGLMTELVGKLNTAAK